MFYFACCKIGLLVAWFSPSVIVRYKICRKIPYYRNRVLLHRDGTQRAAWKKHPRVASLRQLSCNFLRSKTFAKTMFSKESFREAVCECTELKDPSNIRTIWADMLPSHLVSTAHYQQCVTKSPRLVWWNTVQVCNCMSHNLSIMGLLRSKVEGRISFEIASTIMVFLQASLLRLPFVRSTDWSGKNSQTRPTSSLAAPVRKPGCHFEQVL